MHGPRYDIRPHFPRDPWVVARATYSPGPKQRVYREFALLHPHSLLQLQEVRSEKQEAITRGGVRTSPFILRSLQVAVGMCCPHWYARGQTLNRELFIGQAYPVRSSVSTSTMLLNTKFIWSCKNAKNAKINFRQPERTIPKNLELRRVVVASLPNLRKPFFYRS